VVDGNPIDTRPGFMLVVPPRTVHHDVAIGRYSQYFIQFRTQQSHPWLLEAPHEADPALEFVFASIARESDGHASHREELLGLLLAQFEVLLERSHQRQPRSRLERLVHQVEAIFQERHRERLSLTALVEELGISEATLRYQFQQVRGKAPKTVLQEIRTRNALRLIGSSSLNLDEIAARCGFDSASHLARFVKQYTGHTPGQFRSLETERN
jgi:AraC-like DNA-binding protein